MAFTREQAQEIATKEAIREHYDAARFIKKIGDTFVFVCYFECEDPNELPDIGYPLFFEITSGTINRYVGLKYLK